MPNFDGTGPHGEGSQTGKQNGRCASGKNFIGLEGRLRQHTRGCKSKQMGINDLTNFNPNEITGVKKCRKGHHSNSH